VDCRDTICDGDILPATLRAAAAVFDILALDEI
jgi:hypothetical protein